MKIIITYNLTSTEVQEMFQDYLEDPNPPKWFQEVLETTSSWEEFVSAMVDRGISAPDAQVTVTCKSAPKELQRRYYERRTINSR